LNCGVAPNEGEGAAPKVRFGVAPNDGVVGAVPNDTAVGVPKPATAGAAALNDVGAPLAPGGGNLRFGVFILIVSSVAGVRETADSK
jgi:hypothetical protein